MYPSMALIVPLAISAILLPIYSDELLYKWFSGRVWLDNGIALGLFPHCTDEFSLKTPKLFLITRLLDSWIYGELTHPLKIRYLGIFSFLIWIGLVYGLCKRCFSKDFKPVFQLSVSLVFLGSLPLMMTLNRPEQALILSVTATCFLPLIKKPSSLSQFFLILFFGLLMSWFFPQHPKTLLFVPFFLTACFFISVPPIARAGLSVWVLISAYSSYSFYSKYHACPLNQNIEQLFSATLISPSMFARMPLFYSKQLVKNVLSLPRYFNAINFTASTEANWLPAISNSYLMPILNLFINTIMTGWLLMGVRACAKSMANIKSRTNLNFQTLGSLTLLTAMFSLVVLQTTKSFYNSTLFFPILIVTIILGAQEESPQTQHSKIKKHLMNFTSGFSLVSFGFLLYLYLPANLRGWKKGGILERQPDSFSAFNWIEVGKPILRLANKCNLTNEPSSRHLVVDDITYSFFSKTNEPYHANYLTGYWSVGIDDLESFLKKHRSDGLICQCRFLPNSLLSKSIQDERFCCISAFN